jgi:hypothetical protein
LTEGFSRLETEHIIYRGYYFIPSSAAEPEVLSGQLQGAMAGRQLMPDTGWMVRRGMDQEETVLQVKGVNYDHCRDLLDQLRLAVGEELPGSTLSWQVEAMLFSTDDRADLGRQFVVNLDGTLHSVTEYNGSVNILAYVPWVPERLMLEEGPVNLNVELYSDPVSGRVRLRAGIPVLLSLSHYPD